MGKPTIKKLLEWQRRILRKDQENSGKIAAKFLGCRPQKNMNRKVNDSE